jgi:hypothetical protein
LTNKLVNVNENVRQWYRACAAQARRISKGALELSAPSIKPAVEQQGSVDRRSRMPDWPGFVAFIVA